jgi:hypothetical protein
MNHYYLGIAYEKSQWYNNAISEYMLFLDLWKDNDSEIDEVIDAKNRLKRIKQHL